LAIAFESTNVTTKRVFIDISPSRVTVAVWTGGKVVDSRTHLSARGEWPTAQQPGHLAVDAINEYADGLRAMTQELRIKGQAATVVYTAPGPVASVTACPAAAGLASAEQAARLALSNVADFPIEYSLNDTSCLLHEVAPKGSGWTPQMHVLAAADAEHRTSVFTDLITAAGMKVERLVAAEAIAITDAVSLATAPVAANEPADQVRAILWIGEHCSALAAGMPGRLLFVRGISIGSESLIDAACRPMRTRDAASEQITLDRAAARTLISAVGIPAPDESLPGAAGLLGASLLPHLQPVLQRLAIETKQSMRFGIPEAYRGKVALRVVGPGSTTPRLGEALARQAAISTEAKPRDGDVVSVIDAIARCASLTINMAPPPLVHAGAARRLRKALVCGAAAAGALIAFEYYSTYRDLAAEREKLSTLSSEADQLAQANRSVQRLIDTQKAAAALAQRVAAGVGDQPDFATALNVLGHAETQTMRLTGLELIRDKQTARMILRGAVRYGESSDPPATINRFMNEFAALPMTESANIVTTARNQVGGFDAQSFELHVNLIPTPRRLPTDAVASASSDARATDPKPATTAAVAGQGAETNAGVRP
jgi:Tfp pilus assembly PilM family ATPase